LKDGFHGNESHPSFFSQKILKRTKQNMYKQGIKIIKRAKIPAAKALDVRENDYVSAMDRSRNMVNVVKTWVSERSENSMAEKSASKEMIQAWSGVNN
jgi:hypothetical protein